MKRVLLLMALPLAGSPIAMAHAQGAVYSACAAGNGEIKQSTIRVDATPHCRGHFPHLVTWNSVGPEGPIGPTGAVGPVGPVGPAGPEGPPGSITFAGFRCALDDKLIGFDAVGSPLCLSDINAFGPVWLPEVEIMFLDRDPDPCTVDASGSRSAAVRVTNGTPDHVRVCFEGLGGNAGQCGTIVGSGAIYTTRVAATSMCEPLPPMAVVSGEICDYDPAAGVNFTSFRMRRAPGIEFTGSVRARLTYSSGHSETLTGTLDTTGQGEIVRVDFVGGFGQAISCGFGLNITQLVRL